MLGSILITFIVTAIVGFVATLFVVARNPKILSIIGAYDQLVKKVKNV